MPNTHAVIMAGGSGTRFWPASRAGRPKHFLPLADGKTLLEATIDRVAPIVGRERIWVVTNPTLAKAMGDVVPDFPRDQILVEPEPRDTAPCVALASAVVEARDPGATMAFMPCDHLIRPQSAFEALLRRGAELATSTGSVITLGIAPDHPATGYGYIEQGDPFDEGTPPASHVSRFREKPDRATAEEFLASGRFLWNSGLFVWTFDTLITAMEASGTDLAERTRAIREAAANNDQAAMDAAFQQAPKTSVDYAVMESAPSVLVLRADLKWDDLGSFTALHAVAEPDADGNVVSLHEGARSILQDAKGCTVYGDGRQAIAVKGLSDVIVVATGDAILVCRKDQADDLKSLVRELPEQGLSDLL